MKFAAALLCVVAVGTLPLTEAFTTVSRAGWQARPARSVTRISGAVPNVVIHHTVTGTCNSQATCGAIMRSMQNHHMNTNGWADIGYNFAVGGDGVVYEGRGWRVVGAHATNWNSNSVGIAFIGDFSSVRPTAAALNTARSLISAGVSGGHIQSAYRLFGHRAVVSTACPGNALQNEISTWPRFVTRP